ncbi:hypothetical protein CPB84DRAFT_1788081 [Gymnopilus junonius]|uniref:Uncharacterized protein n=1 Tax=Gymnopilus junonius TaxID=109634 RepID=A0A9P5NHT2_GYMJU|nr:hypothetical protein CPB84DRAFT_1788081 [Gymnopilus junonius]
MSQAEGVPLGSLWNDRKINVIEILLELWSQRFEKAGALFKKAAVGRKRTRGTLNRPLLEEPVKTGPMKTGTLHRLLTTSFPHSADYCCLCQRIPPRHT